MRVNIASQPTPATSATSPHNAVLCLKRSQSFGFGSGSGSGSGPNFNKSLIQNLRRSCSATFDGHDSKRADLKGLRPSPRPISRTTSFKQLGLEVLEPSLLGIRPEAPEWPAREEVIRDCMARRASCMEIPLSLRMIKLKQRVKKMEEEREVGEGVGRDDMIGNLCCNTIGIIKEVQVEALRIRGVVLDEDLGGVVGKVQKEMSSSFVWLFREVFAKTPDLMLEVMVLTSNFATHSLETHTASEKVVDDKWGVGVLELGKAGVGKEGILEEGEMGLWNSIVEEANEMKKGYVKDVNEDEIYGLREQNKLEFVSPVRVEIEKDEYAEYYRTNLLYQMGLSQEPNSPLLLSNYAQFLWLVSRDYDRAEECFKRAMQLDPRDAEVVSQYANFLWLVRKDLWGAEERFQQAMAAEPDNPFHASRYASFLWNTGAEDTCYPLDSPLDTY